MRPASVPSVGGRQWGEQPEPLTVKQKAPPPPASPPPRGPAPLRAINQVTLACPSPIVPLIAFLYHVVQLFITLSYFPSKAAVGEQNRGRGPVQVAGAVCGAPVCEAYFLLGQNELNACFSHVSNTQAIFKGGEINHSPLPTFDK